MASRVKESNNWGASLHVCIHTNACNGKVAGTRIFSFDAYGEGRKAANAVFKTLAPITPGTSESVKVASLYEIKNTYCPCVYCECDFHDVPEVAKWIIEHVVDIGEAIAEGICNYYGVEYKTEEEETDILYRVQVGAFRVKEYAEKFLDGLHKNGYSDAFIVKVEKAVQ